MAAVTPPAAPGSDWPVTRAWSILGLRYGFVATSQAMLGHAAYFEPGEIYSQFTNWESLEPIDYGPGLDAYCTLRDDPSRPDAVSFQSGLLSVEGDLAGLEREVQDRRWAVLGNQGVWFRFALAVQEAHGILAFHAASIYRPERDELVVLPGKAGAGKTVYLLAALERGDQIFSTEMTYFRLHDAGVTFFRGSLIDNIYVGSLRLDFPGAAERLGLALPEAADPWAVKIAVPMHPAATDRPMLENPTLTFVFPHIERGLGRTVVRELCDRRQLRRMLFENASEKIAATVLLHEALPAVGLDQEHLARRRLEAVTHLLAGGAWEIGRARAVASDPTHCLEGLNP